jgi:hypothetical protein
MASYPNAKEYQKNKVVRMEKGNDKEHSSSSNYGSSDCEEEKSGDKDSEEEDCDAE